MILFTALFCFSSTLAILNVYVLNFALTNIFIASNIIILLVSLYIIFKFKQNVVLTSVLFVLCVLTDFILMSDPMILGINYANIMGSIGLIFSNLISKKFL